MLGKRILNNADNQSINKRNKTQLPIIEINTDIINSSESVSTRDGDINEENEGLLYNEIAQQLQITDEIEKENLSSINDVTIKRQVDFIQENNRYSIDLSFHIIKEPIDEDIEELGDELQIGVWHDDEQLCMFKYDLECQLYTLHEMNLQNTDYFINLFEFKGIKISTVVLSLFSFFGKILAPNAENINLIDKASFSVNNTNFSLSALTYLTKGRSYYSRFKFNDPHEDGQNKIKGAIEQSLNTNLKEEEINRLYNAHLYFPLELQIQDKDAFEKMKIKDYFTNLWTTLKKKAPYEIDNSAKLQEFKKIIKLVYRKILTCNNFDENDVDCTRSCSFGYLLF